MCLAGQKKTCNMSATSPPPLGSVVVNDLHPEGKAFAEQPSFPPTLSLFPMPTPPWGLGADGGPRTSFRTLLVRGPWCSGLS